ncbi:MAG TPA: hypothetical protein VHE33_07000 [Acidobacteriaceae bacterium]|nr:hypothetical protein [Acidobacteriaceae bacterium]
MTLLRPAREVWVPATAGDRHAVLSELQKILASPHFCNSKRYPALLEYIVEHALSGDVERLKERTLGIEVFHRPPDYDTNADTIVRYTAGEVRKRLALYYHENNNGDGIQIVLPVGSYVPEFLRAAPEESTGEQPSPATHPVAEPKFAAALHEEPPTPSPSIVAAPEKQEDPGEHPRRRSKWWLSIAALLVLACGLVAVLRWRSSPTPEISAVNSFWSPFFHEPGTALICSGAVVFAPEKFSGVTTANRDNQYPFVSIQMASAIARLSGLLESNHVAYQMQPCTSIPLNDLRDRPLILLGGYNNDWTMRLVEPLRFTFIPGQEESISDRRNPSVRWQRTPDQPYSSADDYGLIARFHDSTTDSMVIIIAGIGRNGTEAAGLFSTSDHYMGLLQKKLGSSLASGNIEAVIKVSVVDGKTGAPALEDAVRW